MAGLFADVMEGQGFDMPSGSSALPGAITTEDELAAILSRAVTMDHAYASPCEEDDLRLLRKLMPRLLGRAAYVWKIHQSDDEHFDQAAGWAQRVHDEVDEQTVLQCCIFEAIYPQADAIEVPAWVFEDLGQAVEQRCFSWQAMVGRVQPPGQGTGGIWATGGVPDLMTDEAMRWYYYRAVRYMQAGFEAIHLGQVHLVAAYDQGFARFELLCERIRQAAAKYARRGWVILDAHSHGIARQGRLLLDFASRPISARALTDYPMRLALIHRGKAAGGGHPGGWRCDESPVLMEIDNWLGYSLDPNTRDWFSYARRGGAGRWGYDDISWFAHQTPMGRRDFLCYAQSWTKLQGDHWHFQPVVTRPLGRAQVVLPDGREVRVYRANASSPACPLGFGDEDALVELWHEAEAKEAKPIALPRMDAAVEATVSPAGVTINEPVTVLGGIQALLGGVVGDASCPWSRLYRVGPGVYERVFAMPLAGVFSLYVCCGGTQTEQIHRDGLPHSAPLAVQVARAGQLMRVRLDYDTRQIDVTDAVTGQSLVVDAQPGEVDAFVGEVVRLDELGPESF